MEVMYNSTPGKGKGHNTKKKDKEKSYYESHISIIRNGCFDKLSNNLPKVGNKYCCPLCPLDKFKPAWPSKVKKHLKSHDHEIYLLGYDLTVLACHLECRPKKKDKHAHYHCPSCTRTIARKDGFLIHWEECSKTFTLNKSDDDSEDSGCYLSAENNQDDDEKASISGASMDTSDSYPQSQYQVDIPTVSYMNVPCEDTQNETDHATMFVGMDMTDISEMCTEGITTSHELLTQGRNLSTPVAETQTSTPKQDSQLLTCTPVEESSNIAHGSHNISLFKGKQVSPEIPTDVIEQTEYSEYSDADFQKSGFHQQRHTGTVSEQMSMFSLQEDASGLDLNTDDKMECDVVPDMFMTQTKGLCSDEFSKEKVYDSGYDQSLYDTGETHHDEMEKVGNYKEPPDIPVACLLRPWDYTDINVLESYIFGDGKLEDLPVHSDTEMDEIEVLKIRAQRDPVNRVELM